MCFYLPQLYKIWVLYNWAYSQHSRGGCLCSSHSVEESWALARPLRDKKESLVASFYGFMLFFLLFYKIFMIIFLFLGKTIPFFDKV